MSDSLSPLCREFTELLSSKAPVPGGGGAAALCGALSAALASMAGNLSLGKKSCMPHENELEELIGRAQELRLRLLKLIDDDAGAFEPLSRAYSIPKGAADRAEILSAASELACSAPLGILEECKMLTVLLERMEEICSPIMLSDVGCGASLCRSAMEAAAMNVYVNLPAFEDRGKASELRMLTDASLSQYVPRAADICRRVTEKLRMK